eukprot:3045938-Amphidinium_carterae.1
MVMESAVESVYSGDSYAKMCKACSILALSILQRISEGDPEWDDIIAKRTDKLLDDAAERWPAIRAFYNSIKGYEYSEQLEPSKFANIVVADVAHSENGPPRLKEAQANTRKVDFKFHGEMINFCKAMDVV